MYAVQVENLRKTYKVGQEDLNALGGISFQIQKGEILAIIGESGSGKSTLLHILGTLDSPSSGKIFIDGKEPFSKKRQVNKPIQKSSYWLYISTK